MGVGISYEKQVSRTLYRFIALISRMKFLLGGKDVTPSTNE